MTANLRYRLSVASRVLAGFGGGYALTSLLVALLPILLPGNRAVILLWSTMTGFLIYAAIIMAVFHARSATRAWLWIIGASMPQAILLALLLDGKAGA